MTNVTETSNYNNYQVSGSDKCDGAATVIFTGQSGAASISWSNGATGVSTNTLCAGPYTVGSDTRCGPLIIVDMMLPRPLNAVRAPHRPPVTACRDDRQTV